MEKGAAMTSAPADPALWARTFPAPAKLNLFLHVTGRRPDGYHLLQTMFRLIDLQDSLRFSRRADERISLVADIAGLNDANDLCVRAARALREATGRGTGVDIHLDKCIPMGGGLGGGSSDAATTLLALNRLWGLGLEQSALMAIGLRLGADVPFFLGGGNAFAQGVGEQLTPVDLPAAWYLVLVPPVSVPTSAVFADPELTRNSKTIKISSFSEGPDGVFDPSNPVGKKVHHAAMSGRNDLQGVVCRKYPAVAGHLEWLRSNGGSAAGTARMSGSGACVFAEFETEVEARDVAKRLPGDMRGLVARGLEHHPILEVLEDR